MAPCCQNTVTPKMIKAGQVNIGDKIQLDEPEKIKVPVEESTVIPAHSTNMEHVHSGANSVNPGISGIPGGVIIQNESGQRQILPYEQMTSYMGNVSLGGSVDNPSIRVPQSPLTPNGYQEEIDSQALQSFNGFLRTQIGRYMRVEQLVTSDRTEDRLGFLVGVGTNFIILQDITTGNIMVIDIFSIRLTYVYYSSAVVPAF
ncbi:MAG: hypothetical protein IJP00_04430 [Firmicutes bacterium]|nr:hypothetical protein [Bacillota bacterium]